LKDKFLKLFGVETKPVEPDPAAPPPVLSREQLEMKEMDEYYSNFNWELPDQKPMTMPPTASKGKRSRSNSAAVCSGPSSSSIHSSHVNSCHTQDDLPMSPLRQDIIPESPLEEEKDLIPQVSQDYNNYGTTDNSKVLADGIKEEEEEVGEKESVKEDVNAEKLYSMQNNGTVNETAPLRDHKKSSDVVAKGVDPLKPIVNSDLDSALDPSNQEKVQLVSDRVASSEPGR
jgi:hypothetical protein